jgi:hypothetical protein
MSETDNIGKLTNLNPESKTKEEEKESKIKEEEKESKTNEEEKESKKRKFEEEQGESSTQPATRFKQDSSDITSDTEFPDIFDMGGGD